jgi:hypothetical protein
MATDDDFDFRRIVQRVEHRKITLARNAVDAIDTVAAERVDEDPSAASGLPIQRGSGWRCHGAV